VVARTRRLAGQKRVGHAGTLDPMAEGVLPVLLGRATRLADYIQSGRKTYVAVVRLGAATNTDDADGEVSATAPVPPLSVPSIRETLASFTGPLLQEPPRYSALKVGGRRAYAIARGGGDVDLAPRAITIHELCLQCVSGTDLTLEVTCSKGTYIRSLARDLGEALGTHAHLAELTRTRVGPFDLSTALTLDDLASRTVAASLLSASCALPDAPRLQVNRADATCLANGNPIRSGDLTAETIWVYDPDGRLICLATADGNLLRPRIVL
jgi:tRNA pseudouridine55 synthase